jgi:hypothetical protein
MLLAVTPAKPLAQCSPIGNRRTGTSTYLAACHTFHNRGLCDFYQMINFCRIQAIWRHPVHGITYRAQQQAMP